MPTYTVPQFNVFADLWFCGNTPNSGDPDFENQESQLYIYSRALLDIEPGSPELWIPPVWLRMPTAASANWASTYIAEVPAESGRYYLARWKDVLHLGFPNEYRVILMEQCDGDGNPIFRDCCPGAGPGEQVATGTGQFVGDFFGSGESHVTHAETEHVAAGAGEFDATFAGVGASTNSATPHHGEGEGEMHATFQGEGSGTVS